MYRQGYPPIPRISQRLSRMLLVVPGNQGVCFFSDVRGLAASCRRVIGLFLRGGPRYRHALELLQDGRDELALGLGLQVVVDAVEVAVQIEPEGDAVQLPGTEVDVVVPLLQERQEL